MCAFVIEASKGVFLADFSFSIRTAQAAGTKDKMGCIPGSSRIDGSEEFYRSAPNGDESRFNRKRKQKLAPREHAHELLERAAKVHQSAFATVRSQPRSVSA
jgi:hypothetical protein